MLFGRLNRVVSSIMVTGMMTDATVCSFGHSAMR